MLNTQGQRELAYVVKIDEIKPIPDYDRVEYARTNGWWVIVKKGQFEVGDPAIYIEVDSKVPAAAPFEFLAPRHYAVKTLKMCKVVSQGLLMSPEDFGYEEIYDIKDEIPGVRTHDGKFHFPNEESAFLTEELGITYYTPGDNERKAAAADPYKTMQQRIGKLGSKQPFRWLLKREWGKKFLFIFFGKKKEKKSSFPTHFPFVTKTDEERVENIPYILEDKRFWIKTLKIDGTSATYILEKKKFSRYEFYICSRNKRIVKENEETFHKINVYWEMAQKYNLKEKMKKMLDDHPSWDYVCIQGEIAGPAVQGNPHGLKERKLYIFNLIDSIRGRWNSENAQKYLDTFDLDFVPIIDPAYILPDDMETFKLSADGHIELKDGQGDREGYVYRSQDGKTSFKNVSRKYLLRHS